MQHDGARAGRLGLRRLLAHHVARRFVANVLPANGRGDAALVEGRLERSAFIWRDLEALVGAGNGATLSAELLRSIGGRRGCGRRRVASGKPLAERECLAHRARPIVRRA
jgi:hypothetical protein